MLLICCVRHNVCASAFRMRCMQCIWKCCHKISEHGINRQKELWLICVVLWCKFLIANRSTLVSKAPHAIAHTHTHTHCVCNIISFFFCAQLRFGASYKLECIFGMLMLLRYCQLHWSASSTHTHAQTDTFTTRPNRTEERQQL